MLPKPSSTITNFPSNAAHRTRDCHSEKSEYEQQSQWLAGLRQIQMSAALEKFDWVNSPGQFVEQMSAICVYPSADAYRKAAVDYGSRLQAASASSCHYSRALASPLSEKALARKSAAFRRLRPHGTYYTKVDPSDACKSCWRSPPRDPPQGHSYQHWYIDGGEPAHLIPR